MKSCGKSIKLHVLHKSICTDRSMHGVFFRNQSERVRVLPMQNWHLQDPEMRDLVLLPSITTALLSQGALTLSKWLISLWVHENEVKEFEPNPWQRSWTLFLQNFKISDAMLGRSDLLAMKNPSCDLRNYSGGQIACHHMFLGIRLGPAAKSHPTSPVSDCSQVVVAGCRSSYSLDGSALGVLPEVPLLGASVVTQKRPYGAVKPCLKRMST